MLLQDLYDRLATGELSQHKMGNKGAIQEDDMPTLINHLNVGLTNLYSYFPISEKEVIIQQFEHITEYRINSKYALTNEDPSINYKWVMDSAEHPFKDDIIRIERAYDEVGCSIDINNENRCSSVFTTAWDTIQIPLPNPENVTVIMYRAKHPTITKDMLTSIEIQIPPVLEEALQAYIASRCFVSLGNQASAGLASYYQQKYQQQIDHVERHNLLQSGEGDSNIKLDLKGFK